MGSERAPCVPNRSNREGAIVAEIETTDAKPGPVERTAEFIASPTHNRDGSFTHRPDAVLGFDPTEGEPFGTLVAPVEAPAVLAEEPVTPTA